MEQKTSHHLDFDKRTAPKKGLQRKPNNYEDSHIQSGKTESRLFHFITFVTPSLPYSRPSTLELMTHLVLTKPSPQLLSVALLEDD